MKVHRDILTSLLLVALLSGAWGMMTLFPEVHQGTLLMQGYKKFEGENWRARIIEVGGKVAYEEFAASVASASVEEQHTEAHIFGAALYEAEGIKGLSACDDRFSNGCFHEFLGRAIAMQGFSAVPELNEACFQALPNSSLSCQHGIGHGVQAFLGYEFEELKRGLAVCRNLPYNDPIGGCYGGAFMEYNLRTMLAEQATIREYTGNVGDPCDSVEVTYQAACFFWQPQWWHQALLDGKGTEGVFKSLGEFCTQTTRTEELVRACFEGIGNIVSSAAGFSSQVIPHLCEAVSAKPKDQLFCKALAANHIGIGVGLEEAVHVCRGLSGNHLSYCLAYARNEANILQTLNPPEVL